MKRTLEKSGYSLIEAVIAVSILSIVISTSLSIILTSTQTEETNQDFLIGNMLANEGAERVKNIYYTNILKFGAENIKNCGFVHTLKTEKFANCDANKISDGDHVLQLSGDIENFNLWTLEPTTETIIEDGELNEAFVLYTDAVPGNIAKTESIDIYVPYSGDRKTEFHRLIKISSDLGRDNIFVTSTVGWTRENGQVRTLDIPITLPLSL